MICLDHHLKEIRRILSENGYLYISTPNYAGLAHIPRYLLKGESFHNPLKEQSKYEFYAHVRYFTFKTLLEFVSSFGFHPEAVYLALPAGSTFYNAMYATSRPKALVFRYTMWLMYHLLSPRWASEPILCFQKASSRMDRKLRKVVL